MRIDPRCKRVNELSDQYHQLFRQVAERYLSEECAKAGVESLCLGDCSFLFTVGEEPSGMISMADAAKKLEINPSTATRQVNRLLLSGLVTKSPSHGDERRYDVRLTEKGAALLERMDERLYEAVQKTYADVSEEEMQTVYGYLEKCIGQLNRLVQG